MTTDSHKRQRRYGQFVCGAPAGVVAYFSEAKIILDSMGSTGSSAIFRPDYREKRELRPSSFRWPFAT